MYLRSRESTKAVTGRQHTRDQRCAWFLLLVRTVLSELRVPEGAVAAGMPVDPANFLRPSADNQTAVLERRGGVRAVVRAGSLSQRRPCL